MADRECLSASTELRANHALASNPAITFWCNSPLLRAGPLISFNQSFSTVPYNTPTR